MSGFGEGEGELLTLHYPKPLPMRLDRWLVSQRPEQSRARIQKFIDADYVRVNGVTGKAKTPLRQGDEVQLWMPPPEPLPYLVAQPIALDVLYEDAHLIVINKPAGLTVHPAPGNKDGTLVNGLLHHCPDLPGHRRGDAARHRASARQGHHGLHRGRQEPGSAGEAAGADPEAHRLAGVPGGGARPAGGGERHDRGGHRPPSGRSQEVRGGG